MDLNIRCLVRYLRPLPKPAVDSGEGWRLLGDEEVISAGDEYYCGGGLKKWTALGSGAEPTGQTVAQAELWWQDSYKPVFYRRRVTPLAPQEWTPTDERISLQKFTNGAATDWRVV